MTRILVVDDDETIAGALAERLRSEGFTVSLAADGRAALATTRAIYWSAWPLVPTTT